MRFVFVLALVPIVWTAKTCNVLDYGAAADNSTDVGPAMKLAYSDCVAKAITAKASDTILLVPNGSFLLASNVVFSKAQNFTLTISGDLYLPFDSSLQGTMLQWNVSKHTGSYSSSLYLINIGSMANSLLSMALGRYMAMVIATAKEET